MEDDVAQALNDLVRLAEDLPGAFRPEFELGYWAGVAERAERWYVRFEGDLPDNEFHRAWYVRGGSATEGL